MTTYEGSPQSEKTRELFKEFNEKIWAVSFKEFWSNQIVYLCACISPINVGLKFQQICYKSLNSPATILKLYNPCQEAWDQQWYTD